jgi:hypothetical protein
MDNMAYLQQIAAPAGGGTKQPETTGKGFFSKIFNVWTALIFGVVIIFLIIVIVLSTVFSKVDSKDRDLMTRSYFAAQYLMDGTFRDYADEVKNSDIRNMTASLKGVLNEIMLNESSLMLSVYGVEMRDLEESEIALDEKEKNSDLNLELENGRLNGLLDRTFLREVTMQIAYLISYQSECSARTKNKDIENFSVKAESNLKNIYEQFYNFKSPTI